MGEIRIIGDDNGGQRVDRDLWLMRADLLRGRLQLGRRVCRLVDIRINVLFPSPCPGEGGKRRPTGPNS